MSESIATKPMPERKTPVWKVALCLAGLALVAFFLRFHALEAGDLSSDEELATGLPLLRYGELFREIAGRPPLSFVLRKAAIAITGRNDAFGIRIASVIEGVLGVLVLFLFARRVFDARVAWAAAALLCCSHFHITWSRDGRYYPLLMLTSVLLLCCYWEVFANQKLRYLPLCLLAACCVALTHYGGALFLASCALAAAVSLASKPWRDLMRRHARAAFGTAAASLLCAALLAPVCLPYLEVPLAKLKLPAPGSPLSPLFDVSPAFLYHRLADYSGVPTPYTLVIAGLMAAGMVFAARTRRTFATLAVAVLVTPFALLWFFRPDHWWEPKYFIFVLPIITLLTALGSTRLASWCAPRVRRGRKGLFTDALTGLVVIAICVPNLAVTLRDYRHPRTDLQDIGAALARWTKPGDRVHYAFSERGRVLRHYFEAEAHGVETLWIEPKAVPPWTLERAPDTWYLYTGKASTSGAAAALILSSRLSRIAYGNLFLAFGPNTQRIAFGENYPGAPSPDGTLQIGPGESARLPVLFPRAGRRAVFIGLSAAAGAPPDLRLNVQGSGPVGLRYTGAPGDEGYFGELETPFGYAALELRNGEGGGAAALSAIEFLPILDGGPLTFPAWDFYAIEGGKHPDTAGPERNWEAPLLRDVSGGQTVYYRFFNKKAGRVVIRVAALNDPPGANRYQVFVPGATPEPVPLAFDREDGSVSTLETEAIPLERGVYAIAVAYLEPSAESARRWTKDFTVLTLETLQHSGLEKLEVLPLSTF